MKKTRLQIELLVAEIPKVVNLAYGTDELLNTIVNLIRDKLECYYVGLFLLDNEQRWAILQAGTGEAGQILLAKEYCVEIGKSKPGVDGLMSWVLQSRQAYFALDVGEEAINFTNPFLPDTRSAIVFPLISHERLIGALDIQSVEKAVFSKKDISLIQPLADQLATTIENILTFDSE